MTLCRHPSNTVANAPSSGYHIKSPGQVAAFLNAARTFSKAQHETISIEDHLRAVVWVYTQALQFCDRSFIRPIYLEMGRFYETHKLYVEAAKCFKHSMSIGRCVSNLILAKHYKSALNELKNCPSHLMTTKDHTSLFLLELLFKTDLIEFDKNSLRYIKGVSSSSTDRGLVPADDHLFHLSGLLESLSVLLTSQDADTAKDDANQNVKYKKLESTIVNKLSTFLDPAQVQLLNLIVSGPT